MSKRKKSYSYYAKSPAGTVKEFYCIGARNAYLRRTPGSEIVRWRGPNAELLKEHLKQNR